MQPPLRGVGCAERDGETEGFCPAGFIPRTRTSSLPASTCGAGCLTINRGVKRKALKPADLRIYLPASTCGAGCLTGVSTRGDCWRGCSR